MGTKHYCRSCPSGGSIFHEMKDHMVEQASTFYQYKNTNIKLFRISKWIGDLWLFIIVSCEDQLSYSIMLDVFLKQLSCCLFAQPCYYFGVVFSVSYIPLKTYLYFQVLLNNQILLSWLMLGWARDLGPILQHSGQKIHVQSQSGLSAKIFALTHPKIGPGCRASLINSNKFITCRTLHPKSYLIHEISAKFCMQGWTGINIKDI